jgi:hypothetical protein
MLTMLTMISDLAKVIWDYGRCGLGSMSADLFCRDDNRASAHGWGKTNGRACQNSHLCKFATVVAKRVGKSECTASTGSE